MGKRKTGCGQKMEFVPGRNDQYFKVEQSRRDGRVRVRKGKSGSEKTSEI